MVEDQDVVVADLAALLLAKRALLFSETDMAAKLAKIVGLTPKKTREVQVLVECIALYQFESSEVMKEMLRLLPLSRKFGLLEQALLVAVERNVARVMYVVYSFEMSRFFLSSLQLAFL
jgi:hypothetical protein